MSKWFKLTERFIQRASGLDLMLIKLCMYSAGIMMGAALPKRIKKPVVFGAMGMFVVTYLPLAIKMIKIAHDEMHSGKEKICELIEEASN